MKLSKRTTSMVLIFAIVITMLNIGFVVPVYAATTALPIYVDGTINNFAGMVTGSSGNTLLESTGDTIVDSSSYLQLTDSGGSKVGTIVRRSPIKLNGGFSTYFVANMRDLKSNGGDGLCFIVYDSKNGVQSGGTGINLGYSDYDHAGSIISGDSVAVELDTCCNDQYEGLLAKAGQNYRHVAIDTNDWDGSRPNNTPSQDSRFSSATPGANIIHYGYCDTTSSSYSSPTDDGTHSTAHGYSSLNNGSDIYIWVDLTNNGDGTSGVTVTYGPSQTRTDSSNYSFKRQLSNQNLLNDSVYVGFSASTGSAAEFHDIKSWYFSNTPIGGGIVPTGGYTQAASGITVDTRNASSSTTTDPTKAVIQIKKADGTDMATAQNVLVSVDSGSASTILTDTKGTLDFSLSSLSAGSHKITALTADGSAQSSKTFTVTGITQLSAPDTVAVSSAGIVSWGNSDSHASSFTVNVYKEGVVAPVKTITNATSGTTSLVTSDYISSGTGNYDVTVTAVGDHAAYNDSTESTKTPNMSLHSVSLTITGGNGIDSVQVGSNGAVTSASSVPYYYFGGADVTITAIPGSARKVTWTGDLTGNNTNNTIERLSIDKTIAATFTSSDATLKTSSMVKGQTVATLGTPNATLGSETAGSVTITAVKAADTTNATSFVTLFDPTDTNVTSVKVVKYASGVSTANFAADVAYANEAITNGDFIIIKVVAQDGTTTNYYRINVIITSSDAGLSSVAGQTDGSPGGQSGADTTHAITWTVNVANAKATLGPSDIAVTTGASFNLYSNAGFTTEITGAGSIALTAGGATTAFIKVTAQDTTTVKYYAVTINRAAAVTQAMPSFSPAGGAIAFGSTVTITSVGADHIYYATGGTDPATSAGGSTSEYTAPITINSAVTIKAIAVKAGNLDSAIGSASYTQAASADLTDIVLSGSPSNYTFAGSTYTYNGVTVDNSIPSITVTPTGAGTITVDGTPVTSGQASGTIALTAGVEKTITVVATETGKSAKTYIIKVTREILNAPPAPTIQSAVAGDAHVSITWNSVSGATGYKIYNSTASGSYGAALAAVDDSVYSYDATGLNNGTTYYFVVKASNDGGDSVSSNEVSATPQVAAPGAPVLQSANAGDGYINITWSAVAGSTGYKVYVSTTSAFYMTPVTTVAGIVYSYDVTGLTNGTTYYFVVKAANPGGDSAYSNEISAMPRVSAPSAPTGVKATGGNAKVTLNWNSVAGATGYKIYQSTTSGTYGSALTTVTGSALSYEATGLTNGVTYYFVIKATNAGGDSPNSAEVNAIPKTIPGAPTDVTASAGNGQATVSFTSPVDNGGSAITSYTVTSNPGNITTTGPASPITVTGLTNGTTYTFTVTATNAAGTGAPSATSSAITPRGGSSTATQPTTQSPANTGVDILVNGKTEDAGTATTTTERSQTVTTIAVDEKKLEQKLEAEGNNAVVTIPVNTKADVVVGELNGQIVKNMENKQAVLEVKTENATYTLPAQEINISAISEQIGSSVELKDIKVQVEIAKAAAEDVQLVENSANQGEFSIIAPPVEFSVKCTHGGKTVEVSSFNAYVERTMAIPDGVDPNKITTGVIVDPDGTTRHVPTRVTVINSKYYAVINSLTNSLYSVVWHPIEFKDVANHWAKKDVNDMGSRMVIDGVGNGMFEPDRDITRAEFAAIIVRALGLKPGTGDNKFTDVNGLNWYCDYIKTAAEYKIISGYGNGKFGPDDKITREQAMTMIARAMNITGLKAQFADGEIDKVLASFGDAVKSADYARDSIAACIKTGIVSGRNGNLIAPKENITRAEVAVIVRRLLQKSNLI